MSKNKVVDLQNLIFKIKPNNSLPIPVQYTEIVRKTRNNKLAIQNIILKMTIFYLVNQKFFNKIQNLQI